MRFSSTLFVRRALICLTLAPNTGIELYRAGPGEHAANWAVVSKEAILVTN
jgi:hypothetical protein